MSRNSGVPMLVDLPFLRRFPPLGLNPARLGWYAAFTQVRKVRRRALRATYDRRVARPRGGAEIRPPSVDIPAYEDLPADLRPDADRIRAEADSICRHRVSYLGSGEVDLGPEIDWHRDFKSGYEWPRSFYMDVEVTRLDDDSDAKVPWELSRGHQLLTLARAARIFGDARYVAELEAQLTSWLDANPVGVGINWVNAMEVGIRSVNWLWALGTLGERHRLDPALRARLADSLLAHGRHIATNLEGSPFLRSNHYLSDLLGLLAVGACLPSDRYAKRWAAFAMRKLEREINRQVLPDGVGFEASLPYHGLALEIFLICMALADHAGRRFGSGYVERVARMLDVSVAVRHPDGRTPLFGDNDSGRILPGGFERPPTQDHLIAVGSALLPQLGASNVAHPEVAWTLGVPAWRDAGETQQTENADRPTAFSDGGLYVLEGGGTKVIVRCGSVGQNGNGGHAHNDLLSFELFHGAPLVLDSGTYAYTFDLKARNELRSTRAHNTVMVDGKEINPIPENLAFKMAEFARPTGVTLRSEGATQVLEAGHDGFRRIEPGLNHHRTFSLDGSDGVLRVTDLLSGSRAHTVESFLHLPPDAEVSLSGSAAEVRTGGRIFDLDFTGDGLDLASEQGWIAEAYGVRVRAPVIVARRVGKLPVRIELQVTPRADAA